jgi:pyruvate dehydrogenase E1 component alpha subunit
MDAALLRAREERKPYLIEAVTYRWRGHVGHREDNDVGVARGEDLAIWKLRDPIKRLSIQMIEENHITQDNLDTMWKDIRQEVACSWVRAEKAPFPEQSSLLGRVWCTNE